MNDHRLVTGLLAALLAAFHVSAAQLGDPAKPLQIASWVKGKPVDLAALKGKQIAVIEFWATWCPPCRASIPHLTALQKKFKDVVIVGISDEDVATVKKFVERMGDKMDYVVAVDDNEKTSEAYMKAFGINGIPHAFVVDKSGRIVWHGHPMGDLEKTLEALRDGKFDLDKARKRADAQEQLEAFLEAAQKNPDDPKLQEMGKKLEALDAELGGIEPGEKFDAADVLRRVKFQSVAREYQRAFFTGQSPEELARLEKQLAETAPKSFDLAEFKDNLGFQKLATDYLQAASGRGETGNLPALAKKLEAAQPKNPHLPMRVAWAILDQRGLQNRDYELAAKLARRSVDATESRDASALYVYARALFEGGKTADAIAWQKKALAAVGDDEDARKEMQETLQKYEAKAAAK
ncbi:MAG: redoxin domain-containing protein [Verrucomicrobiae bacterium]|nr:redoxin domain-containing protein [Verrucomicrobiae bacterium]MDW8308246.1 redoxin domain-containing protein [Verrucomicrobiales bacterium]